MTTKEGGNAVTRGKSFFRKKEKRTGNDVFFCLMATANGTQHTLDALFAVCTTECLPTFVERKRKGGKETIRVWYDLAGKRQHLTVQGMQLWEEEDFFPFFPLEEIITGKRGECKKNSIQMRFRSAF